MSKKESIVVICPGRGSYTKDQLGYLKPLRSVSQVQSMIEQVDLWRRQLGDPTITELDEATAFSVRTHTAGEHASPLIYCSAMADLMCIDQDKFEVLAVTGNSMGWYLALAAAKALGPQSAFQVIQTMGGMMRQGLVGGQVIFPVVDEQWLPSVDRQKEIEIAIQKVESDGLGRVYMSIRLGGYAVLAGDDAVCKALLKYLPKVEDKYPFKLVNHAAFHSPLMKASSERGLSEIGIEWFNVPQVPMVDGRGKIWQPYATDLEELRQYTLGHQVSETYDFAAAISVAIKEFAPDRLVLLGPGDSLGGAIAQVLIQHQWLGIDCKDAFVQRQKQDPYLLAMGRLAQRQRLQH